MSEVQAQEGQIAYGLNDAWNEADRSLMLRALELAASGKGQVSPGPLVGCVIATREGKILGEGSYLFDGVKHAEILALEGAGALANGASAYVTLEPHAHHGRTPPCTDALIKAGIARVVVPIEDPNPKVSGNGFVHLRESGLRVEVGLLADEAMKQNEKYIHYMRTDRPFVHLKLACSLDGHISTREGDSRWITGEESRRQVQALRHEYDAILVGIGTVLADDPFLTDRSGRERRRALVRVVLDDKLRLPVTSKLARTARNSPVVVFTSEQSGETDAAALALMGVEIVRMNRQGSPRNVIEGLASQSIQSVLVEGGAGIAGAFFDSRLVDKVTFFIAPIILGGAKAPCAIGGKGAGKIAEAMRLERVQVIHRGCDLEITGYPSHGEAKSC